LRLKRVHIPWVVILLWSVLIWMITTGMLNAGPLPNEVADLIQQRVTGTREGLCLILLIMMGILPGC